jgi:uncharacterized phiE125 gp8 family phage protein
LLNDNAIISLEEAKEYLKVEHDLENNLIEELINQASDIIEEQRGSCVVSKSIKHEPYLGGGDSLIVLNNYPVNDLTEVIVGDNSISLDNFTLESDRGIIHYRGKFPLNSLVKISYSAGYGSFTLPSRYKYQCLKIVSNVYEGRGGEL